MKKIILLLAICIATNVEAQVDLKKYFKFATFYAAANGGNSISDVDIFTMVLKTHGLMVLT